MKVGLFNDSFPPTLDGVANCVMNYADIITKKHGEAVVVTPKYPHVVDNYPYEVYRFQSAKFAGKMPYRVGNPFPPVTLLELNRKNFDLLHVHCPFASAVLANQLGVRPSKRPPMVFTYHTKYDIDIDKFVPNKRLNKISRSFILSNIKRADEVWTVSEGATQSLRSIGYQGEVIVMPNGTDFEKGIAPKEDVAELERMFRIKSDVPMFLFCGRMIWWKNIKIILDSLKNLADAGYKFQMFFVGDGIDRPAIEQYTRNLGLYDCVEFTGAIYDRRRLRAFFTRADLFLFPSTYDTSGLVVKEAAACSTATILVEGSCASEGVEHGFSGLLSKEDPEDYAKKIAEALNAPGTFKTLGLNAAEYVYYSWEESVDKAVKRYEKVIENHKMKR